MSGEPKPRFLPAGDAALTVEFGSAIDDKVNRRVLALDNALRRAAVSGVLEAVPTYRSLLIHYDPVQIAFKGLCDRVLPLIDQPNQSSDSCRRWRVPVSYGGEFGIDLEVIARSREISPDELIRLHVSGDYRVAMIGFTPGFAYLSGLAPRIATPRRPNPRSSTPSGTISIGGQQTGIQCLAGPSGWHLLGRTPVRTFHPHRDPIFLMEPGDAISFYQIDQAEFERLDRLAEQGDPVASLIAS
jgi:KipI family sensor histidine kinase inhibitor